MVISTVCQFPPPKPTQKPTQERQPTPSNNQPTNQPINHQPNTKQRTQERHIKSCCVCVAPVSAVWCAGGYWMSWRLAFASPPIDNKQPTTNQPTNNQPTANTHDTKTNKFPTTHPKADTGATHQVMMCLCRSCVRCLVCWWILDVMAIGLRRPTNRQQTTSNQQPTNCQPTNQLTTNPKADTEATTNSQTLYYFMCRSCVRCLLLALSAWSQGSRNLCPSGPAGCAEHLNKLLSYTSCA